MEGLCLPSALRFLRLPYGICLYEMEIFAAPLPLGTQSWSHKAFHSSTLLLAEHTNLPRLYTVFFIAFSTISTFITEKLNYSMYLFPCLLGIVLFSGQYCVFCACFMGAVCVSL